ncbi:uncharacterized protein FIBRA_03308 [Fibroporia radiculosa]|uniref:Uncharacterized protein n=1 Tax=Fibroporia radiculosa TaxID=599839 RepID=J4H2C0_9APHY|nr:uncharacterized protein FIBRA_03308 [Fibroporia radiculosa]CCM01259.1 predicted protein [Fibroporia radiculosa]
MDVDDCPTTESRSNEAVVRWKCSQPTSSPLNALLEEAAKHRRGKAAQPTNTLLSEHSFQSLSSYNPPGAAFAAIPDTIALPTRSRSVRARRVREPITPRASAQPELFPTSAVLEWNGSVDKVARDADTSARKRKEMMEIAKASVSRRGESSSRAVRARHKLSRNSQQTLAQNPISFENQMSDGRTAIAESTFQGRSRAADSISLDGFTSGVHPHAGQDQTEASNSRSWSTSSALVRSFSAGSPSVSGLEYLEGVDTLRSSWAYSPREAPLTPPDEYAPRKSSMSPHEEVPVPIATKHEVMPPALSNPPTRLRVLGMRPVSYPAHSSSQLTPSQILPTKQKPFKPPIARPPHAPLARSARLTVPTAVAPITPDYTPPPADGKSHAPAVSKVPRKGAKRSPSPAPDANSSFGEIELPFDFETLDAEMRKYD